jgi:hypothetical protein
MRRSRLFVALCGVGLLVFVCLILLVARSILPSGPAITVSNDRPTTVTLDCGSHLVLAAGKSVQLQLNDRSDNNVCDAAGPGFTGETLCLSTADFNDGELVKVSSLLREECP